MKLTLPLKLRALLLAAIIGSTTVVVAETINLPSSDDSFIVSEDTEFVLTNSVYYVDNPGLLDDFIFSGNGDYNITFKSQDGNKYDLSFISDGSSPFSAISSEGFLEFKELGNLTFEGNNNQDGSGGAIRSDFCIEEIEDNQYQGGILFQGITGDISFIDNKVGLWENGGAISSTTGSYLIVDEEISGTMESSVLGGLVFNDITGDVSFVHNMAGGDGGAIYSETLLALNVDEDISGTAEFAVKGGLIFNDITGDISFERNVALWSGGAIYAVTSSALSIEEEISGTMKSSVLGGVVFNDITGNISFDRNITAGWGGGAIYSVTGSCLNIEKEISGTAEFAVKGGLIFNDIKGDISFEFNVTAGSGGAIYSENDLCLSVGDEFSGSVDLTMQGGVLFNDITGDISFERNTASSDGYGGAIYSRNYLDISFFGGDSSNVSIQGGLMFNDITGDISFEHNTASNSGGAIHHANYLDAHDGAEILINASVDGDLVFNDIRGNISFLNNEMSEGAYGGGGAILVENVIESLYWENEADSNFVLSGNVIFSNIQGDEILFSGNKADANGGAIMICSHSASFSENSGVSTRVDGSLFFRNIESNIIFKDNSAFQNDPDSLISGGAIAISAENTQMLGEDVYGIDTTVTGYAVFDGIRGNIEVKDNMSEGFGSFCFLSSVMMGAEGGTLGVARSLGGLQIQNVAGDVTFSGNVAQGQSGGAIAIISTSEVSSDERGADLSGIAQSGILFQNIAGDVTFSGNSAVRGGAVSSEIYGLVSSCSSCPIVLNDLKASSINSIAIQQVYGDVLFEGNKALGQGGAIYLGEIEVDCCYDPEDMPDQKGVTLGNSLLLSADGGDIIFRGNTAGEDRFAYANAIALSGESAYIDELRAASGRNILFYDSIQADSFSDEILHINKASESGEYKGSVVFSGELVQDYIVRNPGESDALYQIRLEKSLHSVIQQDVVLHDGTLFATKNASLETSSMTVNQAELKTTEGGLFAAKLIQLNGAKMDIMGILSGNGPLALDSRILSGYLSVWDKQGDLYSASSPLNGDAKFALLTQEADEVVWGGFSLDMEDDRTENPYGVQGEWTLSWDDEDVPTSRQASGNPAHTLYASWVKTGFIVDPEKDRDSRATVNALWTSKSNLDTFTRSAMGQLNAYRFLAEKDTRYWAMALGDVASQGAKGFVDGYDYWGGGYAIGSDTRIGKNWVAGFGLGELIGSHQGRSYRTKIDQDSMMGLLYASYMKRLNDRHILRYDASLGYALTSNTMKSYDKYGEYARGKWDNHTLGATFRFNWDYSLSNNWTLNSFAGVEYSAGRQEGFTESGRDPRHFDKTDLRNVSLPVGVGFTNVYTYDSGRSWMNSISVSYVPDVYRENPGSPVHFVGDDTRWHASGINSARNAGRLDIYSRYNFKNNWSLYAGYQLEFRNRGCDQNANLGVSVSF